MVLATQNPIDSEGTYPLPEAQLDRFLFKIDIGFPTQAEEVDVVKAATGHQVGDALPLDKVQRCLTEADVARLQQCVSSVLIDDRVVDYAVRLARATRGAVGLGNGAGSRGAIALVRAARAAALIAGPRLRDARRRQAPGAAGAAPSRDAVARRAARRPRRRRRAARDRHARRRAAPVRKHARARLLMPTPAHRDRRWPRSPPARPSRCWWPSARDLARHAARRWSPAAWSARWPCCSWPTSRSPPGSCAASRSPSSARCPARSRSASRTALRRDAGARRHAAVAARSCSTTCRATMTPAPAAGRRSCCPAASKLDVRYEITPTQRGKVVFEPAAIRVRSRLGLADLQLRVGAAQSVQRLSELRRAVALRLARRRPPPGRDRHQDLRRARRRHRLQAAGRIRARHAHAPHRLERVDAPPPRRRARVPGRPRPVRDVPARLRPPHARRRALGHRRAATSTRRSTPLMLLAYVALKDGDAVGAMTFGHDPSQQRHFAPAKGMAALNSLVAPAARHRAEPDAFRLPGRRARPDAARAAAARWSSC